MATEPLLTLDLSGIKKLKSGKVREVFDLGDRLLFVATDRISAFDVIMPNGIPRKGEVLTQISYFWFAQTESFQPNHLLSRAGDSLPPELQPFADGIARRSMIVRKAKPLCKPSRSTICSKVSTRCRKISATLFATTAAATGTTHSSGR